MYSLLYRIFFALKRVEKRRAENGKASSRFIRFIIGYIEWFYNIPVHRWYQAHPSTKYMLNKSPRKQKIIVSFTSYPKRIGDVYLVVETLLRQSMKPDMIILWLAESQFPTMDDVPAELRALQRAGLTIRFCDDLRSHKKYFYAMQEFPDDLIILVDDDTFYSRDLVKKLIKLHTEHPDDIVCMTPTLISNITEPPSRWHAPLCDEHIVHSFYAQPYTGQGTLYPPHCFDEALLFNKEKVMQLCPHADDLWLKFMSLRKGVLVTSIHKYRSIPITIYGTAADSLYYINGSAEGNQNDVQWQNLLNEYGAPAYVE